MTYVLHSVPAAFGVRNASPFSLKAETLLRMAGVDYERRDATPNQGPRRKLPFLTTPEGDTISDSRNILVHLQREARLSLPSAEHDVAVRRLAEEHLYWSITYFRWVHHTAEMQRALFGTVPGLFRGLVFGMVRRKVLRQLHAQGTGRRPETEILELALEDLEALDGLLEEAPFFGGDRIATADVVVHATTSQLDGDLVDPLTEAFRDFPRLVAHQDRVERSVHTSASVGPQSERRQSNSVSVRVA